ncbi:MAG: HEAT repeat domain-containing protein [Nitrospira sp.]|mgnify:CR=1 FL=1|nr:MAG: HEAT repeat domain-containing protein [Nitrospira sp.]
MKTSWGSMAALSAALILAGIELIPLPAGAATPAPSPKDEIVRKYVDGCQSKPAKEPDCDKIRKSAVEILKEDLLTLGSSANHSFLLSILPVFKIEETELRVAAADAIGMIGPQDSDAELLAPLANDPVPEVRRAVTQMLSHGKGSNLKLLWQRTMTWQGGLTPEVPADSGKYSLPVAPDSTYLFYASTAAHGRVSYITRKGMEPVMAFYKGKSKRGPLKLDEFNTFYRYQLSDEQEARERIWKQISDENSKQVAALQKDTSNQQAAFEKITQLQNENMNQRLVEQSDQFRADLFEAPTVFVLEERQIGQRSYPTRYVVLYQEKALKSTGYRLSWMTVPDEAIKAAQLASLVREKEEEARKKENEALKKRAEELKNLEKKKDEAEKKKFKKGQDDLEKALGF